MELLGLEPGISATERLDHLTRGPLPEQVVRALVAATGMTTDQARALTTPPTARPGLEAIRRMAEENLASGRFRRGGQGKTSTSGDLAGTLARTFAHRAHMIDPDTQGTLDQPGQISDLEDLARRLLDDKHIHRAGAGKTRTDAEGLARLLAATRGPYPLLFDLPVNEVRQAAYTPVFADLDWPADSARQPVEPAVIDKVAKALGIGQDTDAPRHE